MKRSEKTAGLVLSVVALLAVSAWAGKSSERMLSESLSLLEKHVDGGSTLTAAELNEQTRLIRENIQSVGDNEGMMRQAFDLVGAYDETFGPLFMNQATRNGFKRKPAGGLELERAVFAVQQGLLDVAYTPENLEKYEAVLNGAAFRTAEYFPGAVDAPKNSLKIQEVLINASHPEMWGHPVMNAEDPARRPTGCYLAPGTIAEVTVPSALVDKGFTVRIGAHSWDLEKKPVIKRLDRVTTVYPIKQTRTRVANPLGGGIYIEVPYRAEEGPTSIHIRNAVRSPFFSSRSFDKTTLAEWKTSERYQPGPWTDFQTDKFMMQVPSAWIRDFDDPVTLMQDWDQAMDAVSELFGRPPVRSKEVLYLQVDVILRGGAYFPGYPQSNTPYNPHRPKRKSQEWLLKGPQHGRAHITFHELGHAHFFSKFPGETEAAVNVPYVAVLNKKFGESLDHAFGRSFGIPQMSLDQAAITWMVTENFRAGNPMNISNKPGDEVKYQHRGYGRYVEIANLFGWDALGAFWHADNVDYMDKGIEYSRRADPIDGRIVRLAKAAGVDLRPLIHFWGVQPDDDRAVEQALKSEGLKPSAKIYDRLQHYKTVIPMNHAEFAEHARVRFPKGIGKGASPKYGEGWYYVWLPRYEASHGRAAQKALQEIIDHYFPNGRPVP